MSLFQRLRGRRVVDRDMADELTAHLETRTAELVSAGVPLDEARLQARRELGNATLLAERSRDVWRFTSIEDTWRDLGYAWRQLRRAPAFATAATLTLALGIGANTAIFSLVNALLLKPLPVRHPEQLVLVSDTARPWVRVWSQPVWQQLHRRPQLFDATAAWSFGRFALAAGGETAFVDGIWASGSFFQTFGVPAAVGRTFGEDADDPGGGPDGPVAVVSWRLWQRQLGGTTRAIGEPLRLDGISFRIVGVTPPEFFGPEVGRAFDVIVPIGTEPLVHGRDSIFENPGTQWLTIVARLKPSQTIEAATAALRAIQSQVWNATIDDLRSGSPDSVERYLDTSLRLAPAATGFSNLRDRYRQPLFILLAIVAMLLLVACTNVANLLIARAVDKRHDLLLRLALGASRWQLARQLLIESALLSSAGAVLGLVIAGWGARMVVTQISTGANPVFLDLPVDHRVVAFLLGITVATTLLFGTAPAYRTSRSAPVDAMKRHGGMAGGAGYSRLAKALMSVQVALTVVLTVGAGLFIGSLTALVAQPVGFEPDQVLVTTVDAQQTEAESFVDRLAIYQRARDAISRLPGVADAALSFTSPFGRQFTPSFAVAAVTTNAAFGNLVSPRWFSTFGTPLVAGRDFTDRDRAGAAPVAIVNQAFVRKFFGDANPLGETLTLYPGTTRAAGPFEIVGVSANAVYSSLRTPAPPTWYVPLAQFDQPGFPSNSFRLTIRSANDSPSGLTRSIADAVASADPRLTITFASLTDEMHASVARERLLAVLGGAFAMLALLLSGMGLYGVMAHHVAARRREIGIRMALGGRPRSVAWLVVPPLFRSVALGLLIGVVASVWISQTIASLLYHVEPGDLRTTVGAVAALAFVAMAAAWLPARRAAAVDPATVLREA